MRGTTTVDPTKDPAALLRNAPNGLTARDRATILIGGGDPERADIEKARRHLSRLVDSGLATKADGVAGGAGGGQQTRYYASARHLTAVGREWGRSTSALRSPLQRQQRIEHHADLRAELLIPRDTDIAPVTAISSSHFRAFRHVP